MERYRYPNQQQQAEGQPKEGCEIQNAFTIDLDSVLAGALWLKPSAAVACMAATNQPSPRRFCSLLISNHATARRMCARFAR